MYVLCTSLMYHLSTQDHNLYTFAQSTLCLYICSYFLSHDFFIHVHVSDLPAKNEKRHLLMKLNWCVSV